MKDTREFNVIIYGASGFTGRLIAEYLTQHHGDSKELRWALAGRNKAKIAQMVAESGLPADTPIISADANDLEALTDMARRGSVVLSAVGPYQLYGSTLVEACVKTGTDYVDLCGEPTWMREMIDRHQGDAERSGARIVFSCGFDSIPSDLGVYYLQRVARERTGGTLSQVKGRVRGMRGFASGGTLASMQATMAAAARDPELQELLKNPFSLAPGFAGPPQPNSNKPTFDKELNSWAAPFVMAVINIPNVHRSNALLNHAYGRDFSYSEMVLTGPGEEGEARAKAMATPTLAAEGDKVKPGEGPSREEQEAGFYDLVFLGDSETGERIRVSVSGDRDPGYGSTSRMITESALALALDNIPTPGGIWTPAAAMGDKLIERLTEHAGLVFKTE